MSALSNYWMVDAKTDRMISYLSLLNGRDADDNKIDGFLKGNISLRTNPENCIDKEFYVSAVYRFDDGIGHVVHDTDLAEYFMRAVNELEPLVKNKMLEIAARDKRVAAQDAKTEAKEFLAMCAEMGIGDDEGKCCDV